MLLYYIRHAEPIYNPDSITEFGKIQAASLAKRMQEEAIDEVYASSCGRALMTAEPTCKLLNKICIPLDFAREDKVWADMSLEIDGRYNWCFEFRSIVNMFKAPEVLKLGDNWYDHEMFKDFNFKQGLQRIDQEIDIFLEKLGYVHNRKKKEYVVKNANDKKIAFVAHSGFGMAFVSSVLDIPYNVFSSTHLQMGTTHITIIEFKDIDGLCIPRMKCYSDGSHLYKDGLIK